ncbi:MAG: hypothetical protein V3V08_19045 [Nannocystaceae bacterium]
MADNLLARSFTADAPDKIWVTDVTALWTLVGWVFLAAISFCNPKRLHSANEY